MRVQAILPRAFTVAGVALCLLYFIFGSPRPPATLSVQQAPAKSFSRDFDPFKLGKTSNAPKPSKVDKSAVKLDEAALPEWIRRVPKGTTGAFAFYNVFAAAGSENASWSAKIVADQLRIVQYSGLLEKLTSLFFMSIGPESETAQIAGEKMVKIGYRLQGSEAQTIHELWNFCRARPEAKVLCELEKSSVILYLRKLITDSSLCRPALFKDFHPKGSFRSTKGNIYLRKHLDCFVLNPHCLDALEKGFDTCGYRISPYPHMHHPGNYFWAKCTHIAKLVDPLLLETKKGLAWKLNQHRLEMNITGKCGFAATGLGRWFSETWIASIGDFKPADCLNPEVGGSYSLGYYPPYGQADPYCPNMRASWYKKELPKQSLPLHFGTPCGNATMLVHPEVFHQSINGIDEDNKRCYPLAWTEYRTRELYGHGAALAIRWRALYGETLQGQGDK